MPGSPNYRLLLRNRAVRAALERFRPDLIECQDAYNLPWAAIAHRRRHPGTALTAVYMTDFPTVYVERPFAEVLGKRARARLSRAALLSLLSAGSIAASTACSRSASMAARRNCASLGVERVEVIGARASSSTSSARSAAIRRCAASSAWPTTSRC